MTIHLTILGLGQIGASMGLALTAHKAQVTITGHDKDFAAMQAAKKLSAVHQTAADMVQAVANAEMIVLALPFNQVHEALQRIGSSVRPDVLLLDISPAKKATVEWVKQLLPATCHYIGLTPALNPNLLRETSSSAQSPRADLFENSLIAVSALPEAAEGVLKLVDEFVRALGASPYFADLAEADGIITSTEILPQLTAVALAEAILAQPGWGDIRKLAGPAFAHATASLLRPDTDALTDAALNNQHSAIHLLDTIIAAFSGLREAIATQDRDGLAMRIATAVERRLQWQEERSRGDWKAIEGLNPTLPPRKNWLQQQTGGLSQLFDHDRPKNHS
jgi:prephenate dehydrogenase